MSLLVEQQLPKGMSERAACDALDICRNSLRAARTRHRLCGPVNPYPRQRKQGHQPRALSEDERAQVTEVLTSSEYQDQPPAQVYYSLLEQGIYLCSISTPCTALRETKV